jgi:hypothetical protein
MVWKAPGPALHAFHESLPRPSRRQRFSVRSNWRKIRQASFTDPVIRGMSVFHGHLLNHQGKGMMAKILFE